MKKPLMLTTALFFSILPFASLVSAQPHDWGAGPWGYGMHYMWGAWGIGMMLFMLIFWVLIIAGAVDLPPIVVPFLMRVLEPWPPGFAPLRPSSMVPGLS